MVTRMGDQLLYENLRLGVTKEEGDNERIFLAFTDTDNEETHLFPINLNKVEQYVNLIRQTAAGQKIEIATELPK